MLNEYRHDVQQQCSPIYLDCNATTPLDPGVWAVLTRYLTLEYGNEGSRTHEFGSRAKRAVQRARDQVAAVVECRPEEVIFTSGATESNNLAILGLQVEGLSSGRRHLITSCIEHKAVLEPFIALTKLGFEVTTLPVGRSGRIDPQELKEALRPDTLLVSTMHVNNETGIRQPLTEIAEVMAGHPAYLHTDAAQGFGKDLAGLRNPRLDMISISGHKIYGPKGIGALIVRRRGYEKIPLRPLFYGGGQERGLRPGTLPVALIAALGEASALAIRDHSTRTAANQETRKQALQALAPLLPLYSGDIAYAEPNVLNVGFKELDSEALIVAVKDLVAVSNGSACTSASYSPSHVLTAMGMTADQANACVRFSWSHLTPTFDWNILANRIATLT